MTREARDEEKAPWRASWHVAGARHRAAASLDRVGLVCSCEGGAPSAGRARCPFPRPVRAWVWTSASRPSPRSALAKRSPILGPSCVLRSGWRMPTEGGAANICPECGLVLDRDHNAAINIEKRPVLVRHQSTGRGQDVHCRIRVSRARYDLHVVLPRVRRPAAQREHDADRRSAAARSAHPVRRRRASRAAAHGPRAPGSRLRRGHGDLRARCARPRSQGSLGVRSHRHRRDHAQADGHAARRADRAPSARAAGGDHQRIRRRRPERRRAAQRARACASHSGSTSWSRRSTWCWWSPCPPERAQTSRRPGRTRA